MNKQQILRKDFANFARAEKSAKLILIVLHTSRAFTSSREQAQIPLTNPTSPRDAAIPMRMQRVAAPLRSLVR